MLDSYHPEGISSMLCECICWISAWLNIDVSVINKFAQFTTQVPLAIKKQLADKLAAFLSASSIEVLG